MPGELPAVHVNPEHEVAALLGRAAPLTRDGSRRLPALETIAEQGARNVLIKGDSGCFALLREERHTQLLHASTPRLEAVSAVGAGRFDPREAARLVGTVQVDELERVTAE